MSYVKRKGKPPSPYRSWLEHDLHEGPMCHCEHEPEDSKLDYVITKTYIPDFVDPRNPDVLYEAKGRFRTHDEAKKYLWVRDTHPDVEIRFIVVSGNTRAYPQTKMTLGAWLDKHGFKWCEAKNVPEDF